MGSEVSSGPHPQKNKSHSSRVKKKEEVRTMGLRSKLSRRSQSNRPAASPGERTTASPATPAPSNTGPVDVSTPEAEGQQLVPYLPNNDISSSRRWGGRWAEGEDMNPFSTRRPRDIGAGLSSGLKNAGKGVALGVAALFAAPAIGASQEGVGGFFKGLGAGVVMGVVLPVAGVGYGITQLCRGAFNTPEAVRETHAGKKWDKKRREWKENWYSLDEEQEEIKELSVVFELQKKELAAEGTKRSRSAQERRSGVIVETEYYDTLCVDPTATQAEIRKAYYQAARDCHPDKNPGDPTAHQRFQALGEAYQVLGDEKRRSDYDTHGKAAAENMPIIAPDLFFTMLFGSEAFEPFIGKLKMAMFVEIFENSETPGHLTEKIMEFEQRSREVKLAVQLKKRLQGYVEGNERQKMKWREANAQSTRELCKHSFGDAMIEAIGWVYENYACQFLGKLDSFLNLGGRYAKLQARNREIGKMFRIAGSAVKASIAATKLEKAEERRVKAAKDRELKEQQKKEALQSKQDASPSTTQRTEEEQPTSPSRAAAAARKRKEAVGKEQEFIGEPASPPKSVGEKFFAPRASKGGEPERDQEEKETQQQQQREEEEEYSGSTAEQQKADLEGAKQLQEAMPLILETLLNVCLMDIEATIRQAAKKVLKDLATPIDTRRQLAEGLLELGRIFQLEAEKYKEENKNVPVDIMKRMEDALIRAAQEADRMDEHQTTGTGSSSSRQE